MAPTDETAQTQPPLDPPVPPTAPPPPQSGAGRARMPGWLPRAMVLALALYACFRLGSWAFDQLIGLLINVLIAFFLALAIEPAVSRMSARGIRRGFATFLVFLGVLIMRHAASSCCSARCSRVRSSTWWRTSRNTSTR